MRNATRFVGELAPAPVTKDSTCRPPESVAHSHTQTGTRAVLFCDCPCVRAKRPDTRRVSGPSARSADANRGSRRPLPQSVTNEQDRGSCWGGSPTTGQTVRTGRRRSHISKVVGGPFSLVPVCAGCTVGPRSAGRTFAARCVRDVPVAPCSKWSPGSPLGLSTYDAEHARRL